MEDKKIENDEEVLSVRQSEFCKFYTSHDREMFGNGVQAYLEVYEIDQSKPNWYKTACVCASQLLSNIKVINRINDLLEEQGFNDENVEKQHLFLLNQHVDLKTKMKAIDSYYKLKGKNEEKENTIVIPIYGGESTIPGHDSNKEDISVEEKD